MSTARPSRQRFSHSRLSTLSDCPRRYRYRYVEKLKESFQGIEAFVGTLVHDVLGWLYQEREGGRAPSADEAAERFQAEWEERHGPSVLVVQRGGHADDHRREGDRMLRDHHAGDFQQDRLETLAIEPEVEVEIVGQSYVGYIDRLARDSASGRMRVIDYKTGKRMPANVGEAGLQVRGYGLAVLEEHGGLEVDLEYSYLRHGKRLQETMARSEAHGVAEQIAVLIETALEAERRDDFPARPSALCAWCGFRDICESSQWRVAEAAIEGSDCPRCGSVLRRRQGRNGDFLGCSGYPKCRFTKDAGSEGRG